MREEIISELEDEIDQLKSDIAEYDDMLAKAEQEIRRLTEEIEMSPDIEGAAKLVTENINLRNMVKHLKAKLTPDDEEWDVIKGKFEKPLTINTVNIYLGER